MSTLVLLGLQAAIAKGSEPTFDGQSMTAATHLRWGFAPEMGFPPGAFWLYRKVAAPGETGVAPPAEIREDQGSNPTDPCSEFRISQPGGRPTATPPLGPPIWGIAAADGWSRLSIPFTLPLTAVLWPPRWSGAPNPVTTPPAVVADQDIQEAIRRLDGQLLDPSLTLAAQQQHLTDLRATLARLVKNFPAQSLYDQPLADPGSLPANVPDVRLNIMQELLLLAINPHMARVLGLYFVDRLAAPGVTYDYCVVGCWQNTNAARVVVNPGMFPAAPLARGLSRFSGITVSSQDSSPRPPLWSVRVAFNIITKLYIPDPNVPALANIAVNTAVTGVSPVPPRVLVAMGFPGAVVCIIRLARPMASVDIELAGVCSIAALHSGTVLAMQLFSSGKLTTITFTAASPLSSPIDELVITLSTSPPFAVVIASLTLHVTPGIIGTRFALLHAPAPITQLPPPPTPVGTFRHREAALDPSGPVLIPRSLVEVVWPAPIAGPQPDPSTGFLPPPHQPLGFKAQRTDSGGGPAVTLARMIATASQPASTGRIYRFTDAELLDPQGLWTYRVAGFDTFGALGRLSSPSNAVGIERIAPAPTAVRIINFDNSPAAGGGPDAAQDAWVGGTLTAEVAWSGGSFISYPDGRSARVTTQAIDDKGNVTGTLTTLSSDITLPAPAIQQLIVSNITPILGTDLITPIAGTILTTPVLPKISDNDPPGMLLLFGAPTANGKPFIECYSARPDGAAVRVSAGANAPAIANSSAFQGRPAYYVPGVRFPFTMSVPLSVPINQITARGQINVDVSRANPFDPGQVTPNPGGILRPRPIFAGQQWLKPTAPPTPVHAVHHEYYDPADFHGRAKRVLPFDTGQGLPTVSGYILQRAAAQSLFLADMKRRQALGAGALSDPFPPVSGNGERAAELAAWVAALSSDWLNAYNTRTGTTLDPASVLGDSVARRAFIEHFYGGLLDDELRAIADIPDNLPAFARVNSTPFEPNTALSDVIDGKGFGRVFYKLAAANAAGSISAETGSIGPYYTRAVTPPRPPVLYKVQPAPASVVVAWSLDDNPDIGGYLVYRGADELALSELRYFGPDSIHPGSSPLANLNYRPKQWPPLGFDPTGAIDPRLIGLTPDPRLFARDYDGSDMAEVILPAGVVPANIFGVYRLSEFGSNGDPLSQPNAFNYWRPPAAGGVAQLVVDSPTQARVIGLRAGLGRSVAVVVVSQVAGATRVIGALAARRAAFVDGPLGATSKPLDGNALRTWTASSANHFYAVAAVDIFGNRSGPSSIFAGQALKPAA
jgi:hypothetical protein